MDTTAETAGSAGGRNFFRALRWLGLLLGAWLVAAYLVLPWIWQQYENRHPWLDDSPVITKTGDGHPGDPLNVGLIGTETELAEILRLAKWNRADALGIESDLRIGVDTVLKRSYADAPVSSLMLFGRKEDLAFEQAAEDNPSHRHHVRFWRTDERDPLGRPVWIGSASFDKRVGLSHTTAQFTHHIDADVDRERDYLAACLARTGQLSTGESLAGFHEVTSGFNGGGDPWRTDGSLWIGTIRSRQSQ